MNILILSAIKKKNLLKAFYQCSKSYDCKIIIADNDLSKKNIKISYKLADLIIKSPKYSKNYKKWLVKTVVKYDVNLVVPTNSKEIPFTEKLREVLKKNGTYLTGVPINIVGAVTDKIKLFNFLKKNKINTQKYIPQKIILII